MDCSASFLYIAWFLAAEGSCEMSGEVLVTVAVKAAGCDCDGLPVGTTVFWSCGGSPCCILPAPPIADDLTLAAGWVRFMETVETFLRRTVRLEVESL